VAAYSAQRDFAQTVGQPLPKPLSRTKYRATYWPLFERNDVQSHLFCIGLAWAEKYPQLGRKIALPGSRNGVPRLQPPVIYSQTPGRGSARRNCALKSPAGDIYLGTELSGYRAASSFDSPNKSLGHWIFWRNAVYLDSSISRCAMTTYGHSGFPPWRPDTIETEKGHLVAGVPSDYGQKSAGASITAAAGAIFASSSPLSCLPLFVS